MNGFVAAGYGLPSFTLQTIATIRRGMFFGTFANRP
jgi:hypothetical protein